MHSKQLASSLRLTLPSPTQAFSWPKSLIPAAFSKNNTRFFVKRDDLIHDKISGNKWRKLSAMVEHIAQHKCAHVCSFGGAYSNHLHALAYLCQHMQVRLTVIVRGDYSGRLTPTLIDIKNWGAHIKFVSKIEYKKRDQTDYCQQLMKQLNADLLIPEGGSHQDALSGMQALVAEYQHQIEGITHVILPVASGGTLAGIIAASHQQMKNPSVQIIGIAVLKGQDYLEALVEALLVNHQTAINTIEWCIDHRFHHGGYAKSSAHLIDFIHRFEKQTNIPSEAVYSGKCFYAVQQMIEQNFFPENSKVLIIHTGGMQGKRGLQKE